MSDHAITVTIVTAVALIAVYFLALLFDIISWKVFTLTNKKGKELRRLIKRVEKDMQKQEKRLSEHRTTRQ